MNIFKKKGTKIQKKNTVRLTEGHNRRLQKMENHTTFLGGKNLVNLSILPKFKNKENA